MTRIGILLSGRGSNFRALADAITAGQIPDVEIALVLSNVEDAPGLQLARERGIPCSAVTALGKTRDVELLERLADARVDLVCLAGYLRLLSPAFIAAYRDRILNIHPSLLPSFPGLHAQQQAIDHGAKVSGCTVHFVDDGLDSGPIVLQSAVEVLDTDDADSLAARILVQEHLLYPAALRLVVSGQFRVAGRRVIAL